MNHVDALFSEFHFGVLSAEARNAVELHLSVCTECLLGYFAFKADVESESLQPSPKLQAALREQVIALLPALNTRRPRWHRPVSVVFASAALILASLSVRTVATGPGTPPYHHTAR